MIAAKAPAYVELPKSSQHGNMVRETQCLLLAAKNHVDCCKVAADRKSDHGERKSQKLDYNRTVLGLRQPAFSHSRQTVCLRRDSWGDIGRTSWGDIILIDGRLLCYWNSSSRHCGLSAVRVKWMLKSCKLQHISFTGESTPFSRSAARVPTRSREEVTNRT